MDDDHAADDQQCCHDNHYNHYHYTTDLITDVRVHSLLKEVRKQVHISSSTAATDFKERFLKVGLSMWRQYFNELCSLLTLLQITHHLFFIIHNSVVHSDQDDVMASKKFCSWSDQLRHVNGDNPCYCETPRHDSLYDGCQGR